MVVRKKVVAKKRRVTTREPKTIIKRKKVTARKTAATKKRNAGKKATAAARTAKKTAVAVKRSANDAAVAEKVKKLVDGGATFGQAAAKAGIAVGLAKRLYNKASVNPKQRIVGSDAEVGKKIAVLRDKENVEWPIIRARTGMSPKQIRDLYEDATGKSWKDSGTEGKKTRGAAKTKPAGKRTGAKKTTARKAVTKRAPKSKPTAARGRKAKPSAAKKATASAKADAKPAGETKRGQRAQRDAENKKVLEALWDLDTDDSTIAEMIEGKTIVVEFSLNGHASKPHEFVVRKVKDVGVTDTNGRVIHFIDNENQQNHVTSTREITAVK